MPTEINRPAQPIVVPAEAPPVLLSGINSPDKTSLGITPLAVAAVLALVLHVASGVMLDRSHAGQIGNALDDCVACPAEVTPPQPALPYD